VTDDDVIMTCLYFVRWRQIAQIKNLRLDEGIMGGLHIGGLFGGFLWGSIDKPNLSFDDNNDDVINI